LNIEEDCSQSEKEKVLEQGRKKKWAKFLIGTAILFGVYKGMEPSNQDFDSTRDYGPNIIQQEFIRLSAQRNTYVAFGDTGHNYPEIPHFAYHQKTLQALEKGGVENYSMELFSTEQPKITAVQEARSAGYDYAGRQAFICSDKAKESLNATFNSSAKYYNNIHFIASDSRFDGSGNMDFKLGLYDKIVFGVSLQIYQGVYGCLDQKAAILPLILTLGTLDSKGMNAGFKDDTEAARNIGAHPGKTAIFYGAGHFRIPPGAKSMRSLLSNDQKTITVIDLFKDAAQKKGRDDLITAQELKLGGKMQPPDAVFYVTPPPGNPDGIEAVSPEAKAIYEQAKENLRNPAIN
jgi:hypothetical protein